jgi:nitrite reductase/ring-hydroxylating ferredoxin subunit
VKPTSHHICEAAAVAEGAGVLASIGALEVGIFRIGGRLVAYENRCAHQGGPVCSGEVIGKTEVVLGPRGAIVEERYSTQCLHLVCPWHGWEYQLDTGVCSVDERIRLRAFIVHEEDGEVYLEL